MQRQGASLQRKDSTVASKATEAGAWSLAEALPALTADEQSENRERDPTAGRPDLFCRCRLATRVNKRVDCWGSLLED